MYYFASDTHLGLRVGRTADDRERLFVRWLDEVSADAEGIFLVGDIFDFWYEYKRVVPRGFTRLLGKLSGLTDRGIPVHFFAGNHDLWAYDYLRSECGVTLHRGPFELFDLYGQKVLVGHGDVLGPRGRGGRFLSALFRCRTLQRLFSAWLHPNFAMRFGQWWSGSNRLSKPIAHTFRGEQEPIVRFAADYSGRPSGGRPVRLRAHSLRGNISARRRPPDRFPRRMDRFADLRHARSRRICAALLSG